MNVDLIPWNQEMILPAVLMLLLVVLIVIRLMGSRNKKTSVIGAEIVKLMPAFSQESPNYTNRMLCIYQFHKQETVYRGMCTLPLDYFIKPADPDLPFLYKEEKLGIPILIAGPIRAAGEEAIEHIILQLSETIPVKYLVKDPSRNYPAGTEGLEIHGVQVQG